ncbi:MAG: hypothetical protein U0M12_04485 [Acutalibacteraceae bacterium]|nr:hypothetical protein [Acutalibacteraceae bacterium]
MNSALIYYTAHKTGYCETSLRGCTEPLGVHICKVNASVSAENFGENINKCLNEYNVLFIVGDISRNDRTGLMPVLSCGLKNCNVKSKQIKAENSKGYLLELENKKLVVLPDQPEKISGLVSATLIDYLKTE